MKEKSKKKKKQKNLTLIQNLGNVFMLLAVASLLYIYYPLLFIFLDPPPLKKIPNKGEYIQIAKIRAQAPIIENVNPWDEKEYRARLFQGVAQAKGTHHVGEAGTIYLFSHSSDMPWNITQYNIAFYRLGELKKNDEINLFKNGKKYAYKVREIRVVWPNETRYIKTNLNKNQLILQTCTPIGTDLQRLLVFADPVTN